MSLTVSKNCQDTHQDVICRLLSGQNFTCRGQHRTVCMAGAASEKLQALIFDCDGKAVKTIPKPCSVLEATCCTVLSS